MRMMTVGFIFVLGLVMLGPIDAQSGGRNSVVAGPAHDGHELTCDLAPQEQFRNVGAKRNGAGCCVFASLELAARAQGIEEMRGFFQYVADNLDGGGWPGRVDDYLAKWFKHKGIAPIPYMQYEGRDPEQILDLIDRTGRMACVTYGTSPRYNNQQISHMVCSPGYRGKYGVILDNNFPAKKTADGWNEDIYEWMSKEELVRRAKLTGGSAWIFVWLPPGPPPPAKN